MLTRRRMIALPAAGLVAASLPASLLRPALAQGSTGGEGGEERAQISFRVYRGEGRLGSHRLTFTRSGDDLEVRVEIRLQVKFGPITVFRYEHDNTETWRDGRLVAIRTRTNDDGTDYEVDGEARDQEFAVRSSSGARSFPADIIPTSYWHPQTVERSRMLDTQRGRDLSLQIAEQPDREVRTTDGPVTAQAYRVTGDLELDLFYNEEGDWLGTTFTARGEDVTYELETLSGFSAAGYMAALLAENG